MSQQRRYAGFYDHRTKFLLPAGSGSWGPQNAFPACISRCSRIGPRLSAGKKVRAPTITIVPTSSTLNRGVVTGNVPAEGGTACLRARFPAIASIGMIMKNRPISVFPPRLMLYQEVLPLKPPNADPLFAAVDTNAYKTSEKPCGPGLRMADVPNPFRTEIAVSIRMVKGNTSVVSIAILISKASIFLPKYSGVRPTINPAINTANTT